MLKVNISQEGVYWLNGGSLLAQRRESIGSTEEVYWLNGGSLLAQRRESIGSTEGVYWLNGEIQFLLNSVVPNGCVR